MKSCFSILYFLLTVLSAQEGYTISGYVVNEETGESLIGANVILKNTLQGASTDKDGYFVIHSVYDGEYLLEVSYLGYKTHSESITMLRQQVNPLKIELKPTPIELTAVDITAQRIERRDNIQLSRTSLDVRQLKSIPQMAEADLFRTLQSLPGVLTSSEFSTGLVIRGGNTDQNLILLDGITVYNPSHVGGLFSNFILDVVKEADLLKGGFNAEYGGRLSAVLNVRSREGNRKRFSGKSSVSLLSAKTTLEGPVGKGAWLVSGRRTYFDQVFKGTDLYFPYYFYDVQGHIFQDLTERDRVSVSWYSGRDDLSWDEFGLEGWWGNNTFSLNYRKLLSQTLVSNFLVAKSRFDIYFGLGGTSGINEEDYIDDLTFRSDWTWFCSPETEWRFGAEYKDLKFVYSAGYMDSTIFDTRQSPVEAAGYVKTKHWLSPLFMIEPGLRLNYYSNHPDKWYLEPRLGMKYLLTEDRYLNVSVGLYHQFMETIQDDYNPNILDAWFAVDSSVTPASAVQYVAGIEEYFGTQYKVQIEAYYKTMNNMLTFIDNRASVDETVSDETLDDLVDEGDGYAYGGEIFLQKEYGKLNGWIAYSYSISRKIFDGKEYYTNWDRRHAFNIIANYQLNKKWNINAKWTLQTGQPYTPILGYFVESMPDAPYPNHRTIPGGRNSARYPNYHRLDIGAVRRFKIGKIKGEFTAQIVNTYWQKNVFRYVYQFGSTTNGIDDDSDDIIDEEDEGKPQLKVINGIPIIPSIGVSIEF
ncbi:MAG: TonB-dependent receptor [Candidatus Marinimicrobia bacterium]|nr:TonB-dependent receptor [Candidatus Neomarinimicrobiota bacterium]